MVPERYRLASVGRFLLQQFELRRPGFNTWTPEVEASLRAQAEAELQQMERQSRELGFDEPQYFRRVRGAIEEILLPRYSRLVADEIDLQSRHYGIWRGGDLVARGLFALAAFILGIIAVEVPYIPIQAKWFPALLFILGPLFPDIVLWWYRRRYHRRLEKLVADLSTASEALETYQPLSELSPSPSLDATGGERIPMRERS
jgi:hypothetical protein